nr:hypothetical protein [Tanacetum cinerariifolium]
MTVGLAVCKNYLNDDIIYTTLKDGNLDQHETCRRLKMIRDVREVSKLSVDEVFTMLKECNMDQTETCQRLKMIYDIRVVASEFSIAYVYTMLKECNMDQNETCRRLKMIHDVRDHEVASKYSVDDVYTLLKECNMDPSKATQRLSYIDFLKLSLSSFLEEDISPKSEYCSIDATICKYLSGMAFNSLQPKVESSNMYPKPTALFARMVSFAVKVSIVSS